MEATEVLCQHQGKPAYYLLLVAVCVIWSVFVHVCVCVFENNTSVCARVHHFVGRATSVLSMP